MEDITNPVSPKFSINREDIKSIARGALIALGGALVTYFVEVVPQIDFGQYTPVVVALVSILLNALRKYLSVTRYN